MGSIIIETSSAQNDVIGYTPIDRSTMKAKIPPYESFNGLAPNVSERGVAASHKDPLAGYSTPVDSSKGSIDKTKQGGARQIDYTAEAVKHYADSAVSILKGGAAITNGYLSKMSAKAKEYTYQFQAEQNRRAADMLLANQKDITRAAQMDANRYKIEGVETKAKQKTAMAGTGFAVGKGTYKNLLSTTEARVNYNVANLMLKSKLENAELTRKSGAFEAQAIIDEANAKIAKKEGEMAVMNGWISGISNFLSAGASFYCGKVANGDFAVKTDNKPKGK